MKLKPLENKQLHINQYFFILTLKIDNDIQVEKPFLLTYQPMGF